jgi:carbonic anhydrase
VEQDLDTDASGIDFLTFASLEQAVRDDIRFLLASPLISGDVVIRGFVYDVRTGRVRELDR